MFTNKKQKTKSYWFKKPGEANELKIKTLDFPEIEANHVLVKNSIIGINHTDIHVRNGSLKFGKKAGLLGLEGGGTIEAVGKKAGSFQIGQKVVYCTRVIGSYAEHVVVPCGALIALPDDIAMENAVACLYRGLMSHTLLYYVFDPAKVNNFIYINGATGGVGHILIQMAKYRNLNFIAGVGGANKVKIARDLGCKYVVDYQNSNLVDEIRKITQKQGVAAVYDCLGSQELSNHIEILSYLGILVNYGDVTGDITALNLAKTRKKSLFFTKPDLNLYKSNRKELILSSEEMFNYLRQKILTPKISYYEFRDIPSIHKKMENRDSIGVNIVKL